MSRLAEALRAIGGEQKLAAVRHLLGDASIYGIKTIDHEVQVLGHRAGHAVVVSVRRTRSVSRLGRATTRHSIRLYVDGSLTTARQWELLFA